MNKPFLNSICVLRLSALGDCINAFGLINAIHEQYPEIQLDWVIDSRFASLFVNESISSSIKLHPVDIKKQGFVKSWYKLFVELYSKKFDAIFNLQTSIKASVLSLCIRAKLKYGYDKERRREGQILFINRQAASPKNPHVLAGFMSFATSAGLKDLEPCWDYHLSDSEMAEASELVQNHEKIFTISPASAKLAKNWTIDGYVQTAKHAISKGFKVVLVGSPSQSEMQLCKDIEKQLKGKCLNLCGKTSLRVLACVIKLSKIVLSPDSAAMHLASSLNVPVISLHAIHNPDRVGAWSFRHLEVSVYQELAAEELQGQKVGWRYRVKTPNAMSKIKVEAVTAVFDKACVQYNL